MTNRKKKGKKSFILILLFMAAIFYISYPHLYQTAGKADIKDSVDSFFKELKNGNVNQALKYAEVDKKYSDLESKLNESSYKELSKAILSKLNYSIEDISVNGSKAVVKIKMEAVDLFSFYSKYSKELNPMVKEYAIGSEAEKAEALNKIKAFLEDRVKKDIVNGAYEKFQGTTKINMVLKDGKWIIDGKDNLMYYLTGKLTFLFNEAGL